jgi:hypothetical protein
VHLVFPDYKAEYPDAAKLRHGHTQFDQYISFIAPKISCLAINNHNHKALGCYQQPLICRLYAVS